jgi:PE family
MPFVNPQPDLLAVAAGDLTGIGTGVTAGSAAAADPVSALNAAQFAAHARLYQQMAAQAAVIHQQFLDTLAAGSGSYAETEAANAPATS